MAHGYRYHSQFTYLIFYMYSFCKHGIRNLHHWRLFAHIVELTPVSYLAHGCLISDSRKLYIIGSATMATTVYQQHCTQRLCWRCCSVVRHNYTGSGGSLLCFAHVLLPEVTWWFQSWIQSQAVSWVSCHMREKPLTRKMPCAVHSELT